MIEKENPAVDSGGAKRIEQDQSRISNETIADGGGAGEDPSQLLPAADFFSGQSAKSLDALLVAAADYVLCGLQDHPRALDTEFVRDLVLDAANLAIGYFNEVRSQERGKKAGRRQALLHGLTPLLISRVLVRLHHCIRLVPAAGPGELPVGGVLAIYDAEPGSQARGLYLIDPGVRAQVARRYAPGLRERELAELESLLSTEAEVKSACVNPNLVAVRNGIYDMSARKLTEFTPELVFTSKTKVDYVADAPNPQISMPGGETWDVESWMKSLSDDPEVVELLWEVVAASLRPTKRWGVTPWFYSTVGRNGKGTLLKLMTNMVPSVSIDLAQMNTRFGLGPLLSPIVPSLMVSDENAVNLHIDDMAALKSLVTHDPVSVERKGIDAVTLTWRGFIVQCINELPRVRDHTKSLMRRILLIPFTKSFEGIDRPYIRDNYLERSDVLEYVQKRCLEMDFEELSEPAACRALKGEFEGRANPVLAFWEEYGDRFEWDLLPSEFLYAVYKVWYRRNMGTTKVIGKKSFISRLKDVVGEGWTYGQHRSGALMDGKDGLGGEFNVPGGRVGQTELSDHGWRGKHGNRYWGFRRRKIQDYMTREQLDQALVDYVVQAHRLHDLGTEEAMEQLDELDRRCCRSGMDDEYRRWVDAWLHQQGLPKSESAWPGYGTYDGVARPSNRYYRPPGSTKPGGDLAPAAPGGIRHAQSTPPLFAPPHAAVGRAWGGR